MTFPLAIVAVILALVALFAGKFDNNPSIDTISSTCMTGEHDLDIRAEGNSIVITTPIQTPNPCHVVGGDVKISGREIEVDLHTVPKEGACIECVGEVTGRIVIPDLAKGIYGVKVSAPGKAAITTIMIE